MLLNLSKSLHFNKDERLYNVDYIFTKQTATDTTTNGICLELNVSVNDKKKKIHRVNKASSTLYLSNEAIEKIVEEETLLLAD
jgi:hypothetical protein